MKQWCVWYWWLGWVTYWYVWMQGLEWEDSLPEVQLLLLLLMVLTTWLMGCTNLMVVTMATTGSLSTGSSSMASMACMGSTNSWKDGSDATKQPLFGLFRCWHSTVIVLYPCLSQTYFFHHCFVYSYAVRYWIFCWWNLISEILWFAEAMFCT